MRGPQCSLSTISATLTRKHPSGRQRGRDFPESTRGPEPLPAAPLRGWQSRQGALATGVTRCRQSRHTGFGDTYLCACRIEVMMLQG